MRFWSWFLHIIHKLKEFQHNASVDSAVNSNLFVQVKYKSNQLCATDWHPLLFHNHNSFNTYYIESFLIILFHFVGMNDYETFHITGWIILIIRKHYKIRENTYVFWRLLIFLMMSKLSLIHEIRSTGTNNHETFLQYFPVTLKHSLQNHCQILNVSSVLYAVWCFFNHTMVCLTISKGLIDGVFSTKSCDCFIRTLRECDANFLLLHRRSSLCRHVNSSY